jgi:hypothetical protein
MRYLILVIAVLLASMSVMAQQGFELNFNVDRQPAWGPTGYDHVEYYYFPGIEAYYNVPQRKFIYRSGRHWVISSRLPSRYEGFDLYHSYKVVVNDRRPYRNHESYRDRYASYRDRYDQESIRDSRDSKYFVNKGHPEHDRWAREQRRNRRGREADRSDNGWNQRDGGDNRDNRDNRDNQDNRDNSRGEVGMDATSGANIGEQPAWGPTGYDRADYYYIPDINSYYSVSDHLYIYWGGSDWMRAASLPATYGSFNPYTSYKVVLNERDPFHNNSSHREKYGNLRGMHDQPVIRDSHDAKYFASKEHPEHNTWMRTRQR